MTPKEILESIAKLEKELASLKERVNIEPQENLEPKVYLPEIGEKYWYLFATGEVANYIWKNDKTDNDLFTQGNVFLTQQEAQKEAQYRKLRAKYVAYVKEYNDGWVADWSDKEQVKYYLQWHCFNNFFHIINTYTNLPTDLDFIFKGTNFTGFILKRMTHEEIRAVINHDLSCIEVGDVR